MYGTKYFDTAITKMEAVNRRSTNAWLLILWVGVVSSTGDDYIVVRTEVGGTAVLRCSVEQPTETVVWVKDIGELLVMNDRVVNRRRLQLLKPYALERSLQIESVKSSDAGLYKCLTQTSSEPLQVCKLVVEVKHETVTTTTEPSVATTTEPSIATTTEPSIATITEPSVVTSTMASNTTANMEESNTTTSDTENEGRRLSLNEGNTGCRLFIHRLQLVTVLIHAVFIMLC